MRVNRSKMIVAMTFGTAVGLLAACGSDSSGASIPNDYAFVVKGVSGNHVMLDRTWYQDCISGGEGVWTKSMRTLSGHELATTVSEYQNSSTTADCDTGFSSTTVFVQSLTIDDVEVPITWTDAAGEPASAPQGMEDVKVGNGATGIITFATMTATTDTKAVELNGAEFCGKTDWAAGDTVDLVACFGTDPARGTIVVDDRTATGKVYDGFSVDPAEYPTLMPNYSPHQGPLNGIEF